jgi:hypothetical protein
MALGIIQRKKVMEKEIAEAVKRLNEKEKLVALRQVEALQKSFPQKPEVPEPLTWTGCFRGTKREGNIIYPEWG